MTRQTTAAPDEPAIRNLLERRAAAIRAKDVAAELAPWTPEVVNYDLTPPLQYVGAEAHNPEGLRGWFDTWKGPIGYDLQDFSVTAGEELAYCYGLVHMSGTRTDGEETDVWVRQTLCLRPVEGAWKITHEHTSVPFYMDGSNKAAIEPQAVGVQNLCRSAASRFAVRPDAEPSDNETMITSRESQMAVKRIVANVASSHMEAAKRFYSDILGMEVVMDLGWIITLAGQGNAAPQISIAREGGSGTPVPDLSIEVDDLDETYKRLLAEGLAIEYGPASEPWGVTRLYVRDPFGRLLNVLAHQ